MVGPALARGTAIVERVRIETATTTFNMIPAYRSCYDLAMRILVVTSLFVTACIIACGAPPKKDNGLVNEGSDTAPTCCCKTIPVTDDKEITPQFAMAPRMECSTSNGTCVDDVQCNGSHSGATPDKQDNGVPPPPTLGGGSASSPAVP